MSAASSCKNKEVETGVPNRTYSKNYEGLRHIEGLGVLEPSEPCKIDPHSPSIPEIERTPTNALQVSARGWLSREGRFALLERRRTRSTGVCRGFGALGHAVNGLNLHNSNTVVAGRRVFRRNTRV